MRSVGIFEAKTHFSALVEAARDGETIVITRNGKPVAQMVPMPTSDEEALQAMDRILSTRGKLRGISVRELIPTPFRVEVQNALLQAIRRNRLKRATVEARLLDLDNLRLSVDPVESLPFSRGFILAERFRLSAYDAVYPELAVRTKRLLMTVDDALRSAASTMNVLWQPSTA
jgi:prevent-host-death family protein